MRKDAVVSGVLGADAVLTPSDLYNKEFRRAIFGGYSTQEVDAYLERVADVLESLIRQIRELREQLENHKARLEEYRQIEETLRSALVTSQKFGENLIDAARREADSIVEAARAEKGRVLSQAAKLPTALEAEINQLQELRDRLRTNMLAILTTHRTLLDTYAPIERIPGKERDAGTEPSPSPSNPDAEGNP
jgi:cell division initiation protein